MNVLIFDTETTGLVRRNLDPTDPKQPMLVQLGLKLDAFDRKEMGATNMLIKTNGNWTISQEATNVHGITDALADKYGTELISAYEIFLDYIAATDVVVAHNASFDIIVMQRAGQVYAEQTGTPYRDPFEDKKVICTMLACTPIVKARPKRNGQWKWPKLEECMQYFFGESIEGAHDALVDVRACGRVFYHLIDTGVFTNERGQSLRS